MRRAAAVVDRLRDALRPGPARLRLHLGVHKTATTHVQAVLDALAAECAARRVTALTPATTRRTGLMGAILRDARERDLSPVRRRVALGAALRRCGVAGGTLVLSEENVIGNADCLLVDPPFPHLANRTRNLQALAATAETEIFVAIRSWDEILPSAYATALRFRPVPGGFDAPRAAAVAAPPCWVALVERIGVCFPGARLRLWRHEDYRAGALAVVNAMVGGWLTRLPEIPDPISTRTPSAAAVALAEQTPDGLDPAARSAIVDALYARDLTAGGAKFMPFTPAERDRLRAAYDAQTARLRARHPDAFLI